MQDYNNRDQIGFDHTDLLFDTESIDLIQLQFYVFLPTIRQSIHEKLKNDLVIQPPKENGLKNIIRMNSKTIVFLTHFP